MIAALAQVLSALLVGPEGTGWKQPFAFSPALFLAYPVVLTRLFAPAKQRSSVDMALLVIGIALDLLLIQLTISDDSSHVLGLSELPSMAYLWITFWLSWQVPAIVTISRGIRHRGEEQAREDA